MRPFFVTLALAFGLLGLVCIAPDEAQGRHRRGRCGGFYGPAMSYPAYHGHHAHPFAPMPAYPQFGYGRQAFPSQAPYMQPSKGAARGAPAGAATVAVYDNYFEPRSINVPPGTTVRWMNGGQHTHTVTANDGSFDSGDLPPGGSYTATFSRPGTYYYICRHHEGMQGTVVVGQGGSGPAGGGGRAPGY